MRGLFSHKLLLLTTLLFFDLITSLNAAPFQQSDRKEVHGIVQNEAGIPLAGITVTIAGGDPSTSTVTNSRGLFQLRNIAAGSVIQCSGVGYETARRTLGEETDLTIVMRSVNTDMDEVVVVGYGTQKSKSISSAISKIKGDDLNDRPALKVDNALAGKLAGVQVQEISGQPGKALTVKVRGTNSINFSSTPLYVVDGFPLSSGLDNINPNDIESIEVLKDAASAAIYGSRGANGVVLITTRSGKLGKPVISFDTYIGIQKRLSKYKLLNRDQYIDYAIEERNNSWMLQGGKATDPNDKRSNAAYWIDPAWSNPGILPDNDWQKLIEQPAPIQNYQLSASGATDRLKYYFSSNYMNQKGIIIGSDYERFSFLTNLEATLGNVFRLGLNLSASGVVSNDGDSDGDGGPVSRSQYMVPMFEMNSQTEEFGYNPYYAAFIVNPAALAGELTNETTIRNIRANPYVVLQFMKSLSLRSSLGVDYTTNVNQLFKPNNINRGAGATGSTSTGFNNNYLTEHLLSYNEQFNAFAVSAIGGFSYQFNKGFSSALSKTGFADDQITTLNAGNVLNSGSSSMSEWSLMSFVSRANISHKNRHFLSVSMRRDGSSRFGADNKWGWFPAVSGAWSVSDESFYHLDPVVNSLKLRASYGVTGNNNVGDYASLGTLKSSDYALGAGGSEALKNGFVPASFSNKDLGWEKTYTVNVGLDLGFVNNRITLSVDAYRADTKDLLLEVPLPSVVGFSTSLMNIGQVRNKGLEFELNTRNFVGKFKWSTAFNITHNKNEVIKLGPSGAPIYGSSVISNITITKIGAPIGSYYLFIQDGVFMNQEDFDSHPHYKTQQVGDIKYRDVDHNGVIDADDRQIVGNNSPRYYWGLHNNFSYNNVDLYVSLDGQSGNKLLTVSGSSDGQSRANDEAYWNDRWRSPENPGNGWVPRAVVSPNMTTPSTFWLRDASYYRIRTIGVGYNFSQALLDKIRVIKSLRIALNADNVFMHDHNNGSPQTANKSNSNLVPGIDYGATYPLARTFTLNFNFKF